MYFLIQRGFQPVLVFIPDRLRGQYLDFSAVSKNPSIKGGADRYLDRGNKAPAARAADGNLLTEAVDDGFHQAVAAFQFNALRFAVIHGEHPAAEGGDVVILRSYPEGHIRRRRQVHPVHAKLGDLAVTF